MYAVNQIVAFVKIDTLQLSDFLNHEENRSMHHLAVSVYDYTFESRTNDSIGEKYKGCSSCQNLDHNHPYLPTHYNCCRQFSDRQVHSIY